MTTKDNAVDVYPIIISTLDGYGTTCGFASEERALAALKNLGLEPFPVSRMEAPSDG